MTTITAEPGSGFPTERPTGVTILAVLSAIGGVFAAFAGLGMMAMGAMAGAMGAASGAEGFGIFGILGAAAGLFMLAYAVFAFAVAYGLWTRKRWAWYATLVIVAIQALMGLGSLASFELFSAIIGLGIAGFLAWYLLSPGVQAWFSVSHKAPWTYKNA